MLKAFLYTQIAVSVPAVWIIRVEGTFQVGAAAKMLFHLFLPCL